MSKFDIAFKWSVTLKIIKDLVRQEGREYSNKALAIDFAVDGKTITRWLNQRNSNPLKGGGRQDALKNNFGIDLNTILMAESTLALIMGLRSDMQDIQFDDNKVKYYIELFAPEELSELIPQIMTNINAQSAIFDIPPHTPIHINNLSPNERFFIEQYYQGVINNWVPIQAALTIPMYLKKTGEYQKESITLGIKEQIEILRDESLATLVNITGAAGAGKTSLARQLSYELNLLGETCWYRNINEEAIDLSNVFDACEQLAKQNKRLFLFYDSPDHAQYQELNSLLNDVSNARLENLSIILCDHPKKRLQHNFPQYGINISSFSIDESTYFYEHIQMYCSKLETLSVFGFELLGLWEDLDSFKQRLVNKKNKLPFLMAYELTKSKVIEDKLWQEFNAVETKLGKEIYQLCILMGKRQIIIRDEFLTSVHEPIEYRQTLETDLLGLVSQNGKFLYSRSISICKIMAGLVFKNSEEEIRFTRDYLQKLQHTKPDVTKWSMSLFLSNIVHKLLLNTAIRHLVKEYIEDIFYAIEPFITLPKARGQLYSLVARYLIESEKEEQGLCLYELGIKNLGSDHFYTQLARYYFENDQEETALKILKKCVKKTGNVIAITEFCRILVKAGSINKAIKLYQQTILEYPNDAGIHTAYAILLTEENRIDEAYSVFERGSLGQPDTQFYTVWIKTLLNNNETKKAISVFDEAKSNIKTDSGIYTVLANYFYTKGDYEKAASFCEDGLHCSPDNYHLATTSKVLRRCNNNKRAQEVLATYVKKYDDIFIISERFSTQFESYEYDKCASFLLALPKDRIAARDYLGLASRMFRAKQFRYTEDICMKAINIESSAELVNLCAESLVAQSRELEAVNLLALALQQHGNNFILLRGLCNSIQKDQIREMLTSLKQHTNLKNLLLNTDFIELLITTSNKQDCLKLLYTEVQSLLDFEKDEIFKNAMAVIPLST